MWETEEHSFCAEACDFDEVNYCRRCGAYRDGAGRDCAEDAEDHLLRQLRDLCRGE